MTEILKATRKTMQIIRVFMIILLLNEITYDFFSLSCVNAFLSSVTLNIFYCHTKQDKWIRHKL
jgi:hypothetical protein